MLNSVLLSLLAVVAFVADFAVAGSPRETLAENLAADGVVYATDPVLDGIFDGPRDFHVVALLTGEGPNIGCSFCDVLGPNFRTVAYSYGQQALGEGKEAADRDVYFVVADFVDNMQSFRKLGLQQVPNIAVWEPTQSRSDAKLGIQGKHLFMSFKSSGDQVEALKVMLQNLGFDVVVQKPFPWEKFLKFVGTVLALASGAFLLREKVLKVWQAKQIWLALSLVAVVMFIGGHMFNVTRGTPFMGFDGKAAQLIDPNFGSQFAAETQIVAVLYAVLAFTTIGLLKFVPKLEDPKAQTAAAVFGASTVLVVYSVLLDLFNAKMGGGYFFTLLPMHIFS